MYGRWFLRTIGAVLITLTAATAAATDYTWKLREPIAYDGDTLYIELPGLPVELRDVTIRVLGVDTPEIKGKCTIEKTLAVQARDFVRQILTEAETVAYRGIGWDKYGGRIDAVVLVNGTDLAKLIVEAGLGRPYDGGAREPWCPPPDEALARPKPRKEGGVAVCHRRRGTMKAVIEGKRYDTETATEIDRYSWGMQGDFGRIEEYLYVTKNGAYFTAGSGGANTKYAVSVAQNSRCGGSRIEVLTKDEAREWAERHSDADTIAKFFTVEDA